MSSNLKRGLFLVTIIGALSIPGEPAEAADHTAMPGIGIEAVLNDCYAADTKIDVESYLVPTEKGEYLDMAFANVDADTFLFIRSEPTTESEWVGKLYPGYAAKIIGPVGEWTKIQSGSVTGYVYSHYILIGNNAEQRAQEMAQSAQTQTVEEVFQYAESKEEEALRLQQEAEAAAQEAERLAQERASQAASAGQAIVDYACQFIGNPYVWGGTSPVSYTHL